MRKETKLEKAARLVHEGRVARAAGTDRTFVVLGDTQEYRVVLDGPLAGCSCRWAAERARERGNYCSHVEAAKAFVFIESDEALRARYGEVSSSD